MFFTHQITAAVHCEEDVALSALEGNFQLSSCFTVQSSHKTNDLTSIKITSASVISSMLI